ncbi:MAG: rhomboid family intramembrane serine protease [Saprospiraceae bacterium]|nr:rhomboid family intramembrane serine protease [Saprospiraceae bacterium]
MSVTLVLIILNVLVSWQCFNHSGLFYRLAHRPYEVAHQQQYDRWITSGFVHANWIHLGINMFVLWQFGDIVEQQFMALSGVVTGRIRYATIYLVILVASSLPSYLKHRNDPAYASVGASGAVSGILFAYVLFFPWVPIYLYGLIPIYSILAAGAYLIYSSWASRQHRGIINHDAHFYGALSGMVLTSLFYPQVFFHFLQEISPF